MEGITCLETRIETNILRRRRVKLQMVNLPGLRINPSSSSSADGHLIVQKLQADHSL